MINVQRSTQSALVVIRWSVIKVLTAAVTVAAAAAAAQPLADKSDGPTPWQFGKGGDIHARHRLTKP